MLNFQIPITFSDTVSKKRIQKANTLCGSKIVNRIISLALFLLGGNRDQISSTIGFPKGTFYSFLTKFHHHGFDAFFDKRERLTRSSVIKENSTEAQAVSCIELISDDQKNVINVPIKDNKLIIPPANKLQFKVIVLSFMNSDFLTLKEASVLLGISERHARELGKKIKTNDVVSLIDQRKGQQKEYIFTENIKAQLIQQFTVNIISGGSTSSKAIAKQINEGCNISVSDRAVRQHISKLGLNTIKVSLPKLLDGLKKNSRP